jgi:hypothetical protein
VRKHLFILSLYTLLALTLTWPLGAHFGTHVGGDGSDDPALTWNLWWFKHAVLTLQQSPLTSDYMFYPIGINLAFYTLTLLNDALSLSLQALCGLIPAANLLLLSSFVLSGYGMVLLAQYLLRTDIGYWILDFGAFQYPISNIQYPALIAGLVYAFASCKFLYASLGQFNIASSQWIPFYVLYLFKLRDALRMEDGGPKTKDKNVTCQSLISKLRFPIRHSFLAATFLLLQAYAEFTFASFLIIFSFFFLLSSLRPFKLGMRLMVALTFMGVVFMVGFLPILAPMTQELLLEGDILVQGSGFAEAFSADVLGFFAPSRLHPLMGWLADQFDFAYINFVFIGYITLALALIGGWHTRRSWLGRFWILATLAFILLALGPAIRINGQEFAMPFMPFNVFQLLPFFKGNRYPSRYAVMIVLGLAMLVGFGIHYLLTKGNPRRSGEMRGNQGRLLISPYFLLSPLISLLILSEHLSVPLPLSDFRTPSFYEAIRDDPGDFTVLELPLAWRNGFRVTGALEESAGKAFMLAQYAQTIHGKRMLSGNTSRNPELKFQYFTEAPFINSLIALETGHSLDDIALTQDKQYARDVLRFFNVRYIVLRPEAGETLRPYLESLLPEWQLWREENGLRVYRLNLAPVASAQPVKIDPASPIARLYFAEGWGELGERRVWAQRHEARLLLPLQKEDNELVMRLTAPEDGQRVTVVVNGQVVGTLQVMSGTHEHRWMITSPFARDGVNEVVLRWEKLYALNSVHGLLNARYLKSMVAKSAGQEVGDFAHIWINGVDRAINQRGYNVVFNPAGDSVRLARHFDVFASTHESDRMVSEMKTRGHDVVLAVRDEASLHRTVELEQILQSLGVTQLGEWRWSHVFIRYYNVEARETIIREDASPIRPAIVSIGERITAPQVAGAVEWIEVR